MINLFQAIREAIFETDFNSAIAIIQDALGQTDGGNASIFFTSEDEEYWADASEDFRFLRISQYIKFEVRDFGSTLD